MSEWQTIKTAPKDGTSVLLWDGQHPSIAEWSYSFRDRETGILSDFWMETLDPKEYAPTPLEDVGLWATMAKGEVACDGTYDSQIVYVDRPTHWMTLPPPPARESGETT